MATIQRHAQRTRTRTRYFARISSIYSLITQWLLRWHVYHAGSISTTALERALMASVSSEASASWRWRSHWRNPHGRNSPERTALSTSLTTFPTPGGQRPGLALSSRFSALPCTMPPAMARMVESAKGTLTRTPPASDVSLGRWAQVEAWTWARAGRGWKR